MSELEKMAALFETAAGVDLIYKAGIAPLTLDAKAKLVAALRLAAAQQDGPSTDLIDRLLAYAAKYGPLDPEYVMCVEAAEALAARQNVRGTTIEECAKIADGMARIGRDLIAENDA